MSPPHRRSKIRLSAVEVEIEIHRIGALYAGDKVVARAVHIHWGRPVILELGLTAHPNCIVAANTEMVKVMNAAIAANTISALRMARLTGAKNGRFRHGECPSVDIAGNHGNRGHAAEKNHRWLRIQ
jgi:hypothetical protein